MITKPIKSKTPCLWTEKQNEWVTISLLEQLIAAKNLIKVEYSEQALESFWCNAVHLWSFMFDRNLLGCQDITGIKKEGATETGV